MDGDVPVAPDPQSLQHHSERWRHMSELAGSHKQDDSVLKLQRPTAPLAFKSGLPPQVASRIRTLHIAPQSNLTEWLEVLRSTCFALEHLYLERIEEDGEEHSYSEDETCMRRLFILYRLPDLISIDGEDVTDDERQLARKDWLSGEALLVEDDDCDSQDEDDDYIGDVDDDVAVSQYGVVKRIQTDPQHTLPRVDNKALDVTEASPAVASLSETVAPASSYLARFSPLQSLCSRSDKYLPVDGLCFEIENPHRFQELPLQLPTKELRTLIQQKHDPKRKLEPSVTLKALPERMSFLPKPNKNTPPRPFLPLSPGPLCDVSSTEISMMSPSRSLASPFPMQFITRPSATATPVIAEIDEAAQSITEESRESVDAQLSPMATVPPPRPNNFLFDSDLMSSSPLEAPCIRRDTRLPVDSDSFEIDNLHLQESLLQSPSKKPWTPMQKKADLKRKSEPSATATLQASNERTIFLPSLDNSSASRLLSTPLSLRPCPTICEGSPTEACIMSPSRSLTSPFPMQFRMRPSGTESEAAGSAVSWSSRFATVGSPGRFHPPLSPMTCEGSPTETIMSPSHSLTSPFPIQFRTRPSGTESQATASAVSSSSRLATVQSPGSLTTPLSPMACEGSPIETVLSPSHSLTSPFPMQFRMRPNVTQSQASATAVSVRSIRAESPGVIDTALSPTTTMPSFSKTLRSKDSSSRFSPLNLLCNRSDKYLPTDGHSFEIDNPHRLHEPLQQAPISESRTSMEDKDIPKRAPEAPATVPRTTSPERVHFTMRPCAIRSPSTTTGVSAPKRFSMDESRETIDAPLSPKGIMFPNLPKKSLSKDDRPPPCPGRVVSTVATTPHAKQRMRIVGRLRNRSHIRSTPMLDNESDEEDEEDEVHMG